MAGGPEIDDPASSFAHLATLKQLAPHTQPPQVALLPHAVSHTHARAHQPLLT